MANIRGKVLSVCAALLLAGSFLMVPAPAAAQQQVTTITSFADLLTACLSSRTMDTSNVHYVLDLHDAKDKTLDLSSDQVDSIVQQIGSLTFGSKDNPFKGTFDGRGYTIKGLNYERKLFVPAPDTGLFAWTDGATIKNINFEDAYIGADYRGGVIVGYAKNSNFEHIKLTNCTSSVTPANNAVSLVTNAGLAGGMVAGEAEGCTFYDIEVEGGSVINNSTIAVSGLGGEGLYLGAIAGIAEGSTIEYCRTLPIRSLGADGKVAYTYPRVHNKYDVAVGAVSGQAVYAGGIAGAIGKGTRVIDSFSTADCYTYAATYVSVGAGNVGYVGGIAARSDNGSRITRCHYAGNLHSNLYNALLVIPIIQKNLYLGGIVQQDNDADCAIRDTYFKPSVSSVLDPGTNKDLPSINDRRNKKVYSGASFGPQDDKTYADRSFWESADFDFEGGIQRTTDCLGGKPHINKWIMDYDLGIPVHGSSVKATIDFPGAGTAAIGPNALIATNAPQTTSDPYTFAVQGYLPSDFDMELEAKTTALDEIADSELSDHKNQGFVFREWYRARDVDENRIDPDPSLIAGLIAAGEKVSADAVTKVENTGPGDDSGFRDNDLFIAHSQAMVLFHDVKGGVVDPMTGEPRGVSEADWYDCAAPLPDAVEPGADRSPGGSVSDTAVFQGWTSRRNTEGPDAGYAAVTSTQLAAMKRDGVFYAAGDPVMRPLDLYPVYSDYSSNIKTVFEGHEYDVAGAPVADDKPFMREGVGETSIATREVDGVKRYELSVKKAGGADAWPDGYRFRGWYFNLDDGTEVRLSDKETFLLPLDTDLTRETAYTARFEYRVDYYAKSFNDPDLFPEELVISKWERYESVPAQIEGPIFDAESVLHWGADYASHAKGEGACDGIYAKEIVAPVKLYSHNLVEKRNFRIMVDTDFPSSGNVNLKYDGSNSFIMTFNPVSSDGGEQPGYRLLFWSLQNGNQSSGNRWSYIGNNADTGRLGGAGTTYNYRGRAFVAAEARFHMIDGAQTKTVYRRYDEKVLLKDSVHHNYVWPFFDNHDGGHVNETDPYNGSLADIHAANVDSGASPSAAEMAREGYYFIGWIDGSRGSETEKDGKVWNALYDGADPYCTTDISHALSYIVLESDRVSAPMDLYPIYVKYDYAATTNIKRAGVVDGAGINVPKDPTALPAEDLGDGRIKVDFSADTDTRITDGGDLYKLVSWTVERNGAPIATISATADDGSPAPEGGKPVGNDNAKLSYTFPAGPSYTFVANYEPLAVVYHTNVDAVQVVTRNKGDRLGDAPEGAPAFALEDVDKVAGQRVVFTGWTEVRPEGDAQYVIDHDGTTPLVNKSTRVNRSMELFAVYRVSGATVDSNIDSELEAMGYSDLTEVRTVARGSFGRLSLAAEPVPGYEFKGWYKNYDKTSGAGDLVTEGDSYTLGASVFDKVHYTAAYKTVHEVRYHGADGGVIYTAYVHEDDPRSFIEMVDKIGPDGKPTGETVPSFIDAEALLKINAQLDAAAQVAGATERELFDNWARRVDGRLVPCDDAFYEAQIDRDLDLYPVAWRVSASDSAGKPFMPEMLWALDMKAANDGDPSTAPVKGYFKNPYAQPELSVTVQKVGYGAQGEPQTVAPQPDVDVAVYAAPMFDAELVGNERTDDQGIARFKFNGSIVITKEVSDAAADGRSFSFVVTDTKTGESRTVLVPVALAQDGASCSGSKTLVLPFGTYRVAEDGAWAWRYAGALSVGGKPSASPATLDVATTKPLRVACANERVSDLWLDGQRDAHNVFEAPARFEAPASIVAPKGRDRL